MKTKTLLIAAAALAATVISSQAQVYSGIVGYASLSLTNGFNLVANQLDSDGTGTNNTIASVFGNQLPAGSTVYEFVGGGYNIISSYTKNRAGTQTNWDAFATNSLNPGQAAIVSIPAAAANQTTVTLVGNVLQGSLSNAYFPSGGGFGLVSSQVPLSGDILSNLTYSAQAGEVIYAYDSYGAAPGATAPGWNYIYTYAKNRAGTATNWTPSSPVINVGQGFFISAKPGSTWTNNFVAQ